MVGVFIPKAGRGPRPGNEGTMAGELANSTNSTRINGSLCTNSRTALPSSGASGLRPEGDELPSISRATSSSVSGRRLNRDTDIGSGSETYRYHRLRMHRRPRIASAWTVSEQTSGLFWSLDISNTRVIVILETIDLCQQFQPRRENRHADFG